MLLESQKIIFKFSAEPENKNIKLFFNISVLLFLFAVSLSNIPLVKANESDAANKNINHSGIFPQTQLYPYYIANPLRTTFSMQYMYFDKTKITNTSKRRYNLKAGGHLGLYRNKAEKTNRGWQVTFSGGFQGQFDPASSQDNVGWDGIMALSLEMRNSNAFAQRLGIHHISSHIGDELIERTGLKRINYTRQEMRYGLMWFMLPHWQSYVEIGKSYDLRNKTLQKPWRSEIGFQYENDKYWMSKLGWYMGTDLSSYEENNWDINTSLHLGLISRVNERKYRLGFEFYKGRSPLGEFFQRKEKYISFGLWIDI